MSNDGAESNDALREEDQQPPRADDWTVGNPDNDGDAGGENVSPGRMAELADAAAAASEQAPVSVPAAPQEPEAEVKAELSGASDPLRDVILPVRATAADRDSGADTAAPPRHVRHQQLVDMLTARYRDDRHASATAAQLELYDAEDAKARQAARLAFAEAVRHVTAVAHGTTAVSNTPPPAAALLARTANISDARAQEVLLMRAPGPINIDLLTNNEPGVAAAVSSEYQRIMSQPAEARDGWALLLYVLESVAANDATARGGMVCDVGPVGAGEAVQDGHASERASLVLVTLAFRDSKWKAWATALVAGTPLDAWQSPTPVGYLAHSFRVARAFASDAAFERVRALRAQITDLLKRPYNKDHLYHIQACAALNTVMCCHAELVLACQRAPLCTASASTALPDVSRDDTLGSALYAHAARLRLAGYSIKPILDLMSHVQVVRAKLAAMYVELPPSAPDALLYGLHVLGAMRLELAGKRSTSLADLFVAEACAHYANRPRDGFVTCGIHVTDGFRAGEYERDAVSKDRATIEREVEESSAAVSAATQSLVERGVPARDDVEREGRVRTLQDAILLLYERSIQMAAVYATADRNGVYAQYMESLRARDTSYRPVLRRQIDRAPQIYDTHTQLEFRDSLNRRHIGTVHSHFYINQELHYRIHVPDRVEPVVVPASAVDVPKSPFQTFAATTM